MGLGKHALFQIGLLKKYRPDIEVTDLVDTSIASYYRCLNSFNGDLSSNYSRNVNEALKRENHDVVYISTLSDSHVQIALEIIESGYSKNIIIEKPISNSLEKVNILNEKKDEVTEFLDSLEDDEDVQNVFSNVNLEVN